MARKVVMKVPMTSQKSRSKALKIVVGVQGVDSAALQGPDKSTIEVIGNGIDAVELMTLLRKNVGYAELVSVGEKKEGDGQNKEGSGGQKNVAPWPQPPVVWTSYPYGSAFPPPYIYEVGDSNYDSICSIL